MANDIQPGTLYVVSTPIGNLEDLTFRALSVLRGVDLIAAEDTRTTIVLLRHYEISKPLLSYHSFNEARRTPELVDKLAAGSSIALVSDAGTPGISDPAYRVIRGALDRGLPVVAIPGAAALLPALVTSGLPMDRFVFEGFLPVKKGRRTRLESLASESRTLIFYESPHRLLRTLTDLRTHLGDRRVSVARELTKKFEEVVRGTLSEVHDRFASRSIKGEFVLVVAGADDRGNAPSDDEDESDS